MLTKPWESHLCSAHKDPPPRRSERDLLDALQHLSLRALGLRDTRWVLMMLQQKYPLTDKQLDVLETIAHKHGV